MVDFANVLSDLSLLDFYDTIGPLVTFVIGMALYCFFIYFFYRTLSKRDLFHIKKTQYEDTPHGAAGAYVTKYVLIFPLFVFFWFAVLFAFLMLLSENHDPYSSLLLAMAVVGMIRITAYYREDLSIELAKIMPFTLLGIFLIDISQFSLPAAWEAAKVAVMSNEFWTVLIYYLAFTIAMEFTLRAGHGLATSIHESRDEKVYPTAQKEEEEEPERPSRRR